MDKFICTRLYLLSLIHEIFVDLWLDFNRNQILTKNQLQIHELWFSYERVHCNEF